MKTPHPLSVLTTLLPFCLLAGIGCFESREFPETDQFCLFADSTLDNKPLEPSSPLVLYFSRDGCGTPLCSIDGLPNCGCTWYKVFAEARSTIWVHLWFENEQCDLDLQLVAPDRASVLSTSAGVTDEEEVFAFLVPESGEYLIGVCCREPDTTSTFSLEVDVSAPLGQQIDLTIPSVSIADPILHSGALVDVTVRVANLGGVPVDGDLDVQLRLVPEGDDPAAGEDLRSLTLTGGLAAATVVTRVVSVVLPSEAAPGRYRIAAIADYADQVVEADEFNNTRASASFAVE